MRITKTNAELEVMAAGIEKAKKAGIQLSPKVGYAILKTGKAIDSALAPYKESRESIIREHADENGAISAERNPEGFRAAVTAIEEIARESCEVDVHTVSIAAFGEKEIPLDLLDALDFLIAEEEEKKAE